MMGILNIRYWNCSIWYTVVYNCIHRYGYRIFSQYLYQKRKLSRGLSIISRVNFELFKYSQVGGHNFKGIILNGYVAVHKKLFIRVLNAFSIFFLDSACFVVFIIYFLMLMVLHVFSFSPPCWLQMSKDSIICNDSKQQCCNITIINGS